MARFVSGWCSLCPPLADSLDFRDQLEAKYRDSLLRPPSSTAVDTESDVVWTREYVRYRLNGCGHGAAVQNVFARIDGASAPSTCP